MLFVWTVFLHWVQRFNPDCSQSNAPYAPCAGGEKDLESHQETLSQSLPGLPKPPRLGPERPVVAVQGGARFKGQDTTEEVSCCDSWMAG